MNKPINHTETAAEFVTTWQSEAKRLERDGMYDPADEHASCGVGMIAAIDGKPTRRVVEAGIEALKKIWHRGAVDADGKTGDGAGIHVQIPWEFFKEHIRHTGHEPGEDKIAVGMVFLPKADLDAQEVCRSIVETEVLRAGIALRLAPGAGRRRRDRRKSQRDASGDRANHARHRRSIRHDFERDLYVVRRRIEKRVLAEHINDFYICSLQLPFGDLQGHVPGRAADLVLSRPVGRAFHFQLRDLSPALFDQHLPDVALAQPFRMLAHNGEINTLTGNVKLMKAHEPKMASPLFGDNVEDLKPICAVRQLGFRSPGQRVRTMSCRKTARRWSKR